MGLRREGLARGWGAWEAALLWGQKRALGLKETLHVHLCECAWADGALLRLSCMTSHTPPREMDLDIEEADSQRLEITYEKRLAQNIRVYSKGSDCTTDDGHPQLLPRQATLPTSSTPPSLSPPLPWTCVWTDRSPPAPTYQFPQPSLTESPTTCLNTATSLPKGRDSMKSLE